MKLFYTPQAQDQLQAILRYIAFHNPEAAVRGLAPIRSVAEQLPNFPHMGHESVMRETAYEFVVPGTFYIIVYEVYLMVADYHALTSLKDPKQLTGGIVDVVAAYVAAGVNPAQATIFKQSDVPEHTELAWIFACLVSVPFLQQAHAYKDKVAKGLEANAGLFTYPMLMAADILLYDTDVVPVGEDQRQHIEYAREAAAKFNTAFGETFKEPKEH